MSPEIIAMFGMSVTILLAIWGTHRSLRTEMRMEIGGLRTEMHTGFSDLRTEMRAERNAHIEHWHLHREQQAQGTPGK